MNIVSQGVKQGKSNQRLMIVLVGSLFSIELIIMGFGYFLKPIHGWIFNLLDAVLLVVFLYPVLHRFVIRPLIQENEQHRKTELALFKSEERYRQLVEMSPNAVFIQCGGKFAFINRSGAKMLGADDPTQIIGKTVLEYVHPDYRKAVEERIKHVNAGNPLPPYEYQYLLPNGCTVDVEVTAMPFNDQGQPAAQVIARDVTQRKKAEERLLASEALYLSLVETLPQKVLRKDTSGRFTFANQRFCQLLGKPLNEILGKTDFDFFPEDLAQKYRNDDKRVMESKKSLDIAEEHVNVNEKIQYVQVVKLPLYDAHQQVIGVQVIFWDITDRKNAEVERERLIRELQNALAEVKTLNGIIPICAGCKQIRDDKGYWNRVEAYVEEHSLAKFSHSLCPNCTKIYFPNVKI
jgi:PAS domain S-box-containing protein